MSNPHELGRRIFLECQDDEPTDLRHRVYRLRARLACWLLGLGPLESWMRNPKTGRYEILEGESGELLGGAELNRKLRKEYDAGVAYGRRSSPNA